MRCIFALLLCLASSIYGGCTDAKAPQSEPPVISFYHWKTGFNPAESDQALLEDLAVARLYMRFFDVKKEAGQLQPVGTLLLLQKPLLPITPVVFIDYEALKDSAEDMHTLGKKIAAKVLRMLADNGLQSTHELQLDCDWTESTKDAFFALVREVKNALPKEWTLSVTLRLYQFRYQNKAGVPPADRAILMAYNMGKLREFGHHNSILDPEVAASYMHSRSYPLPLDLALPLFSWGVIFDDQNIYRGLVRRLSSDLIMLDKLDSLPQDEPAQPKAKDMAHAARAMWQAEGSHVYRAQENTRVDGRSLAKGWAIRVERTDAATLQAMVQKIRPFLPPVRHVVYYHLDQETLKDWPAHVLQNTTNHLR